MIRIVYIVTLSNEKVISGAVISDQMVKGLPVASAPPAPGRVKKRVARPEGIEPPTTCLEGRCSIQLSYGRNAGL